MNSYSQQENLTLRAKTKPTTEPPTLAFFLAEARVHSFFRAVMSELENLVRGLSNKVDGIQKDLDNLKKRSGKRKKHGKCRSRRHHRHQSPSESRSQSRSNSREDSHCWRENPHEQSRSRSASPPWRGTRGRHDRRSESPSHTWNNSPPNTRLSWDNVPDTPQYDEVTNWRTT